MDKDSKSIKGVKGMIAVKTVGRWPWRLASAKKCVKAYPSNRGVPKM